MQQDDELDINANGYLPIPRGKQQAKGFREWLTSCLLSAVICLPGPAAGDDGEASPKPQDVPQPSGGQDAAIPIGVIALESSMPPHAHFRHVKLCITLARQYTGQGYGSEAINWALDWAFRRAGMHKVSIGTYEFNTGAVRLYERLGFVHEARFREQAWHDGRWWDEIWWGMLEREWQARKQSVQAVSK